VEKKMKKIYVNRTLNLKKIKAIGLDMDYTIVRYKSRNFEALAFYKTLEKLVDLKKYPEEILKLKFDYQRVIQGLVIDKERGNLLKLSRFGKVKSSFHGRRPLDFVTQQKIYQGKVIELGDKNFQSLDTNFSISHGCLFSMLVELKENGLHLPDFGVLSDQIKEVLDIVHMDGTIKSIVAKNLDQFIIKDSKIPLALERLKKYGKKILLITNSDHHYTKLLLDYTFTPYLRDHKNWLDLFDYIITGSCKPKFFTDKNAFLEVDEKSGFLKNIVTPIQPHVIYQGGNAADLQKVIQLEGEEILYLGDHIYGDVVAIKKTFNWRTGLVLEPLHDEILSSVKARNIQEKIDELMLMKENLEEKINDFKSDEFEKGKVIPKNQMNKIYNKLETLNHQLKNSIIQQQALFNPFWGELMRAGHEESRFTDQVQKYACIYMEKISDLGEYSPRTYFRPRRRLLPHEEEF
jgi:HAD superfamily 5'-nucleotidase-like hydrolase